MKKVEEVKKPLKKGDKYSVPCIVKEEEGKLFITPVINHPHTDIENGQEEVHYHADYRFIKHLDDGDYPSVINKHSKHYFLHHVRPEKNIHGNLEYFILPVINEDFKGITDKSFIAKSKIKHKCIHKGKCPHRGYDLSQVKSKNGIITCPLHGLKFDSKSNKLVN